MNSSFYDYVKMIFMGSNEKNVYLKNNTFMRCARL